MEVTLITRTLHLTYFYGFKCYKWQIQINND